MTLSISTNLDPDFMSINLEVWLIYFLPLGHNLLEFQVSAIVRMVSLERIVLLTLQSHPSYLIQVYRLCAMVLVIRFSLEVKALYRLKKSHVISPLLRYVDDYYLNPRISSYLLLGHKRLHFVKKIWYEKKFIDFVNDCILIVKNLLADY